MILPFTHRLLLVFIIIALAVVPVACLSQTGVLVRVGDEGVITYEDLRCALIVQEGARLLLEMIDTQLIMSAARQAGLSVSEKDLDLKYQAAVARLGSEHDLDAKLEQMRRSKQEFRDQLQAEVLLDRLAQARSPLDDEDLRQYYTAHLKEFSHGEQVRLRLMLFRTKQNADAVAEALKDPRADFAGLAQAFSEDPLTKDKGGDTGYIDRDTYARQISAMAFKLKPGQTSPVFAVPDGYAIIKVEARRPGGAQPFEQLRDTLKSRVQLERLAQARQDWLDAARAKAQLSIPDSFLDSHVRELIAAHVPFEPSNLAPQIPVAPR